VKRVTRGEEEELFEQLGPPPPPPPPPPSKRETDKTLVVSCDADWTGTTARKP